MKHSISWRKSTERTTQAREILNLSGMKEMMSVLYLDHPSRNIPTIKDGVGAAEQIGIIRGYEMCLTMLSQLGEAAPEIPQHISATWGVDDVEPLGTTVDIRKK